MKWENFRILCYCQNLTNLIFDLHHLLFSDLTYLKDLLFQFVIYTSGAFLPVWTILPVSNIPLWVTSVQGLCFQYMLSNYKANQILFITFFFTFLHILTHDRWPKIGPATKSILCLSGLTRIWLQWQPCIVIAFSKPQLATWRCRKSFKILDKNWRVLNQI